MPHRRSYSVSKWLRLATLEPLRVPDAFGEMVPHLASFTNSPVDPSGSVSKPPSANQEENITGERIEATQQRRKGDYMSFVFTGYFKEKNVFCNFFGDRVCVGALPALYYLFIYLSIYLFNCLFIYLSIHLFIFNIFCLFIYLFI